MTKHERYRSLVGLTASALLVLLMSMTAAQQPPIGVSPRDVKPGTSPTLTISSSGFLDLSQVSASQVGIEPSDGVSNLRVGNASPQSLSLSFDLAASAAPGARALSISVNDVTVSVRVLVDDPQVCRPACSPPRPVCDDGICVRLPHACMPRCVSPKVCDDGVCKTPM
jgi:hypothetical protein